MKRAVLASAVALTLLLGGCSGTAEKSTAAPAMSFPAGDRLKIEQFYADQRVKMPTKPKPAAVYKAGDKLAPGMRPNRLPDELVRQLSDPPAPYTRLVVEGDVILVNRDTHDIADVVSQIAY